MRTEKNGVADGIRTHDHLDHNQGLCQLSYSHHQILRFGTPGRIRTCGLRIRSPLLYPTELRARLKAGVSPQPTGPRSTGPAGGRE